MKILITGGSGTIGSYLLRELKKRGHTLSCYSRTPPIEDHADWLQGDITCFDQLKAACAGHEAIVHLAAVPGPGRAAPAQLMHLNLIGTVNALEAAVATGTGKFVFASSGAATGFSFQHRPIVPHYLPIDEDHPCDPQDEYGLSKLLGELTCQRYSAAHGLQTICLRLNHNWYLDRAGAQIAVNSGWAKGLTVEALWHQRYRKAVEDPEGDWPRPGPPPPRNLLWAVTDVRDAVQAFHLALDNTWIKHDVFQINAADTCSTLETPSLIERYFPRVPRKKKLEGHATLVAHDRATQLLGYRPRYTWRHSDFKKWLAGNDRQ